MATPLSADALLAALRAEGVRVVEYRDWRTHHRPASAGAWGPVHGVMIHHTVTSGTAATVELCYEGHSQLPGPLCHGVIAKDGRVFMVGHGRANHAGKGDGDVLSAVIAERALPADNEADTDGNPHFYGFECENRGDGADPWPPEQVDAIVRASAALCRAHGWGRDGDTSVIGHLEWQPGKVDPRPSLGGGDVRMPSIRAAVAERLRHPASWSPGDDTPEPPEEEPMPTAEEIAKAVWSHRYEHGGVEVMASTRLGRTYQHAREARQAVAALTAQVGALTATITTLAQGGGLTAEQIRTAAEAGATAALDRLGEALADDAG